MPLYIVKPIVWNDFGHIRPAGGRFFSGYPKENGYGHEEWNAAAHLQFKEHGRTWRTFHTEKVSNQTVADHPGDVVVFMIASHMGGQYLVGVAGHSTYLETDRKERLRLVGLLETDSPRLASEAWNLPQVQKCFDSKKSTFLKAWKSESPWAPMWKCPADYFHWLTHPVSVDPVRITGKKRFVGMFSTYQRIDRHQAKQLLDTAVSGGEHSAALTRLVESCSSEASDMDEDVQEILDRSEKRTNATQKAALIQARRGQGRFREDLIDYWKGCAVTGCSQEAVLRASHIKPWRDSSDQERLDAANGLLLEANLDALFDVGLITFDNDGMMQISAKIGAPQRVELAIHEGLSLRKRLNKAARLFLAAHREKIFRNE